jgi:hypothetical protein
VLSQQRGEAGGSLTREAPERAASSPDNDETYRYCQTVRARLARWECVTQVNQWLNPRKRGTGSNLVDMGRAAVHAEPGHGEATPTTAMDVGGGGCEEGLRRTRGEAAGEELDAAPIDRHTVNMGTVPVSTVRARIRRGGGQARRQLTGPGWGGVAVVLRARQSRAHGEGPQHVRSLRTGMPGGRR